MHNAARHNAVLRTASIQDAHIHSANEQNSCLELISTSAVPARDRQAYWRDLICDTFVELDCHHTEEDFFGELEDHQMGPLQLTRVRSSKHEVVRSSKQIAKSTDQFLLASLQISGQGLVEQDGRTACLNPGDIAIYDSTRQYRLKFDSQFEELVVRLPKAMLTDHISAPERITATCVSGRSGLGRLAFDFVRNIAREVDRMSAQDTAQLASSVVDLLSNAIATGTNMTQQKSSHSTAHLLRAKHYVTEHLKNPELTRDKVAEHLGISSRYLSKLFAQTGSGFSQWLREQRLQRIADDLLKPGLAERSVSTVAYSWGMNSMPHFCRVFRERFDCTPTQYRLNTLSNFASNTQSSAGAH